MYTIYFRKIKKSFDKMKKPISTKNINNFFTILTNIFTSKTTVKNL